MDPIEKLMAELFQLQPVLERVAVTQEQNGLWSLDLTLPKGTDSRTRIIHTPRFESVRQAFDHARQLVMPRADAAL